LKRYSVVTIMLLLVISGIFGFRQYFLINNTLKPVTPVGTVLSHIPTGELDPAIWGIYYPEQYASYLKNSEITQGNSKYRGSIPFSYLDKDPTLTRLFAGISFSVEYNNKRGHFYALEDVQNTKRISPKTTASCWTCKSPNAPVLISQMGDSFYQQPFTSIQPQIKHAVACTDCHDPVTMQLKVSRQPFREALTAMGKDPDKLTQEELRSAVCGQCHASYYLNPDTKKVVFPWNYGPKPDDLEKYYESTRFTEWSHPEDYAPLIKARHPEYETWSTSVHAQNNASCPDCHMPKEQSNGKTISSHHWQSPLNTIEASCGKCHQDTVTLKDKVISTQDQVYAKTQEAEKAISDAIDAIVKANKVPNSDNFAIMLARAMHRRAQWRWDFVASENSMGFHNPEQSLQVLNEAIDCAKEAINYSLQAVQHPASTPQDKTPPKYDSYGGGIGSSLYIF
jgi:nitrite reductase (cytochrome c-552)